MTKTGDKNSSGREEALELIRGRLPERTPAMGKEFSWAIGLTKLSRKETPPLWVRNAILTYLGVTAGRKSPQRKTVTMEDLASFMGFSAGMAKGARMLFEYPVDTAGFRPEMIPIVVDFQKRMAASVQLPLQTAEEALAKIPEKSFQSTPQTMIAFEKAKSEAVEASARVADEEESTTNELLMFMWTVWPEVKTATSVQQLHEWVTRLGFVNGSLKLFEKVCRKIGYKGSKRGRKRKASSSARKRML